MVSSSSANISPYIELTGLQRENVYQTFKFNRRTARVGMILGVFIPGLLYLGMARFNVMFILSLSKHTLTSVQKKYDLLARGSSDNWLAKQPPASAAEE